MDRLDIKTIKKYTSNGSYHVVYSLDFFKEKIEKWQKDQNLQLNPDFQRGHVWTENQQILFIEHILKLGDNLSRTPPIFFNHPGWMNSWEGEFVCVDGLQRITAILKFLNAELKIFGGYTINQIDNLNLYNYNIPVSINNLKTKAEVLTWYIELNSGGTVHTDEEINKVRKLLEHEGV